MQMTITASKARADIYNLIDKAAETHTPILITGKRNNAVMISEEDWNAIQETMYLNAIPQLKESLENLMKQDNSEFSETIEW
jgi:prevent-host-death family protein